VCGRFPQLPTCGCTFPCRTVRHEIDRHIARIPDSNVYVGALASAFFLPVLQARNITHIVNVSDEKYHQHDGHVEYLHIKHVPDTSSTNLSRHFGHVVAFIKQATQSGSCVLVHCQAGISRSVTMVVAYLMADLGLSYEDALARVQQVRPQANPNQGFVQQLQEWQVVLQRTKAT
jgi:protein-tyrosine phosphatase